MCGLVREEALSVFSSGCVIGDAARKTRHGGDGIFGC